MDVICQADDANKFVDILYFVIKEGVDVEVVLKAKGVGTTIYCKDSLENINFGVLFTHRTKTKEIFVENKGRKVQTLVWQRFKAVEKKQQVA